MNVLSIHGTAAIAQRSSLFSAITRWRNTADVDRNAEIAPELLSFADRTIGDELFIEFGELVNEAVYTATREACLRRR